MTLFSDELRDAVVVRAGSRCEYCHLPTRGQVATFPIDHVLPSSSGGETILDNLALACPHCNAPKWAHTTGADPLSGASVPLFAPRRQVWSDHFQWSVQEIGVLEGETPSGRATIAQLQINDSDMVSIRLLLATLGLFTEVRGVENRCSFLWQRTIHDARDCYSRGRAGATSAVVVAACQWGAVRSRSCGVTRVHPAATTVW